jgi:hypothetical protein
MQTSRFGFKPEPPPFIFLLSSLYGITYSSLSFTTTQDELLLDFTRLVGEVISFVEDSRSPIGILKVVHGFQWFACIHGRTDKESKHVFCYERGVTGVDLATVAFNEEQLDYVSAVDVPRAIERVVQLLEEEPMYNMTSTLR